MEMYSTIYFLFVSCCVLPRQYHWVNGVHLTFALRFRSLQIEVNTKQYEEA